jgi:SAM-dependent methyltransferase
MSIAGALEAAWIRFALDPNVARRIAATDDVADPAAPSPADLTRIRSRLETPEDAAVALEIRVARERGRSRIEDAERWIADRAGLEQASGSLEARHKARRFAERALARDTALVLDLCCGIGGDTVELCRAVDAAVPVLAIDTARHRVAMCRANAPTAIHVEADATALPFSNDVLARSFVHADPARREERGRGQDRRRLAPEDWSPPLDALLPILARARGSAVKLSPGSDFERLPPVLSPSGTPLPSEIELVGRRGGPTQAIWWLGELANAVDPQASTRTATRLDDPDHPGGGATSFTGRARRGHGEASDAVPAGPTCAAAPLRGSGCLLVPDPTLERAGLAADWLEQSGLRVRSLAPGLGLFVTSEPPTTPLGPWFSAHEILAVLPWRIPRLRTWLRDHDAGEVVVRTRGSAVDANRASAELRGEGATQFTVFGLRLGRRIVALMTPR